MISHSRWDGSVGLIRIVTKDIGYQPTLEHTRITIDMDIDTVVSFQYDNHVRNPIRHTFKWIQDE